MKQTKFTTTTLNKPTGKQMAHCTRCNQHYVAKNIELIYIIDEKPGCARHECPLCEDTQAIEIYEQKGYDFND